TTTFTTTTLTGATSTTSTLAGSLAPVANAGPDQFTQTLSTLTFNGSGSFDPGGTIVSYSWRFGDGGTASGIAVTHAYATAGVYTATLTVTDSRGASASDTAVVRVANRPPVANAGPDQSGILGSAVMLRGSGSDPDGTITSYRWDFGGGVVCQPATVFVSKYSPTGARLWSKCLGGVRGGGTGRAVAVDRNGNVLVTGKLSGTVDFGTGPLTSAGASSIFVAKYSAAGVPVWS